MKIIMAASENDALTGGKVGGIGDVVRDAPLALAKKGILTDVIVPSYGHLHTLNPSEKIRTLVFRFAGKNETADIYKTAARISDEKVCHYLIDFPAHHGGQFSIYNNDPPERPFATDALKFAMFSTALAEALKLKVFTADILHLHDWHTAFLLILIRCHKNYKGLKKLKTVYTIHNLALQGVRPFENDISSLAGFYGSEIELVKETRKKLSDPRWSDCFNPMAAGIRLSDNVHTVSPAYAKEILKPSVKPVYYGGEGLEADLVKADREARLFGILNGCSYPDKYKSMKTGFKEFVTVLISEIELWMSKKENLPVSDFIAYNRLKELVKNYKPGIILTSISRIVDQKMFVLLSAGADKKRCIEKLLEILSDKGVYIVLGSGDRDYEKTLIEISFKYKNFIFMNGYSEASSRYLYGNGDLFLMPSSYEPCGIGQMLAMRDGQPCLVNETGGLKDTVIDKKNGYSFDGKTLEEQMNNFILVFKNALDMKTNEKDKWDLICKNASDTRFKWEDSVGKYIEYLYKTDKSGTKKIND